MTCEVMGEASWCASLRQQLNLRKMHRVCPLPSPGTRWFIGWHQAVYWELVPSVIPWSRRTASAGQYGRFASANLPVS